MANGIRLDELTKNKPVRLSDLTGRQDVGASDAVSSPASDLDKNPFVSTPAPGHSSLQNIEGPQHEAKPLAGSDRFFGRVKDAFNSDQSLSENLARLLTDAFYTEQMDPATGETLTHDELKARSQADRRYDQSRIEIDPPSGVTDTIADMVGHIGREATDPIALGLAPIGGSGPILSVPRLRNVALAGGGYEAAAETADQLAEDGGITSVKDIGSRTAMGAAGAVGLDVLFRSVGRGLSELRRAGRSEEANELLAESVDQLKAEGFDEQSALEQIEAEVLKVDTSLFDGFPEAKIGSNVPEPIQKEMVVRSVDADVRSKIDSVLEDDLDVPPQQFKRADISPIEPGEAERLKDAGLDIGDKQWAHSIDNNHIRHAVKRHGDDAVPVAREDFYLLPDIFKNADSIKVDDSRLKSNNQAVKLVTYTKRYEDDLYSVEVVETVRKKKHRLKFKTMYKFPLKGSDDSMPTNDVSSVQNKAPAQYASNASTVEPSPEQIILKQPAGVEVGSAEVGGIKTGITRVLSANDVAHVAAPFRKDAQESFLAVVADGEGNVLNVARVHRGSSDQVSVDPTLVAGSVVNTPGAKQAYIVHNHPSGSVRHSDADLDVSNSISELLRGTGVDYQGSVVVGDGGRVFGHFRDDVNDVFDTSLALRDKEVPLTERRIINRNPVGEPISSSGDAFKALNDFGGQSDGVLLVDSGNHPLKFLPFEPEQMRELRTGEEGGLSQLLSAIERTNADGLVLRTSDNASIGNINGFAEKTGRRLIDAFDSEGKSLRGSDGLPMQSTFYANPLAPIGREVGDLVKNHAGRTLTEGVGGGVIGGISSDEELFTPKWWGDVILGSSLAIGGANAARAAKITGKGGFLQTALDRSAESISKLPWVGKGPSELGGLKRKQRAMQTFLDGEVENIGRHLVDNFSAEERALMGDLFDEKGIIAEANHLHGQAAELDKFVTAAADKAKELGLIPEDLETGSYLHRYYAKYVSPLFKDPEFSEAKGQGLGGTYSLQRGTNYTPPKENISPGVSDLDIGDSVVEVLLPDQDRNISSFFLAKGEKMPAEALTTDREWTLRASKDDTTLLHRDWTKAERESWGEITDAGYRFVRGMAELNHDISLGTLYKSIADNPKWTKSIPGSEGTEVIDGVKWVYVPASKVGKGSKLSRYGLIGGKHVRADVWNGIARYGRPIFAQGAAGDVYRQLLGRWKKYKTVLNPVSHVNNTYSNMEMLYQMGYSPADLSRGVSILANGKSDEMYQLAISEGLIDSDLAASFSHGVDSGVKSSLKSLSDEILKSKDTDVIQPLGSIFKVKELVLDNKFSRFWANVSGKAQAAYQTEDLVFKLSVFSREVEKGVSPTEAANTALSGFFDYNDLPDAVRVIRDLPIGSPFISYTYKALPKIVENLIQNPERAIALFAAYEAVNYAALMVNTEDGIVPGEYWNISTADEDLSPPWEQGRALSGVRNSINIPFADGYKLSLARAHAGGNPFAGEAGNRQFSVPGLAGFWGSDIFGSNPARVLIDVIGNEDWKGREIYEAGASDEEKIRRALVYVYQSWTPSNPLFPGSYHQSKILDGLANSDNKVIQSTIDVANSSLNALGLGQISGEDRGGQDVSTRDAVLGSFGVKARPVNHQKSLEHNFRDAEKRLQEKKKALRNVERRFQSKRLHKSAATAEISRISADIKEVTDHLGLLESQARKLKAQGAFKQ